MINIGLVGCGKISDGHIAALETTKDAKIIAACDISEENLKNVCERTGTRGYSDYKDMLHS
ncbi:MAG: Gfo/Idh/MocA family oxidoreductase [Oscillospiraceae bacterium]|nr:Gfo/Idh/MocA family oxidoreductase [Oscillospiraceae bacterium]